MQGRGHDAHAGLNAVLAGADAEGLEAMFNTARERRDAWLDSLPPPGE